MATKARRSGHEGHEGVFRVFFVIFVFFVAYVFVTFVASVAAEEPADAALEIASAGRTVRVQPGNGDRRRVDIPLETYVARVLAGEGEPGAGDAAQQALAIAIRTFTIANTGRH